MKSSGDGRKEIVEPLLNLRNKNKQGNILVKSKEENVIVNKAHKHAMVSQAAFKLSAKGADIYVLEISELSGMENINWRIN